MQYNIADLIRIGLSQFFYIFPTYNVGKIIVFVIPIKYFVPILYDTN